MYRLDKQNLVLLNSRTLKGLVMAVVAAVTLVACGGDEGTNQQFIGSGLQVFDTVPVGGEFGVDPVLPIEIRLSAPILTSTVSGKVQVSVTDTGSIIPVTTSFAEADTVILINAQGVAGGFPGNAQLKVELFPGIQSTTGQTLQNQFTLFFTTGQGGLSSVSKPGVMVTVSNLNPGSTTIPAMQYTYGGWFQEITFSECVPINSLAANLQMKQKKTLQIPQIEIPLTPQIQQSPYDQRTFYIYINAYVDLYDEIKLKILKTMEDCNGDLLAGGNDPEVNQDYNIKFEADLF